MNQMVTKQACKAAGPNPCVPMSVHFEPGDILKIKHVIEGHVFAFPDGPKAPNISYCFCIGCGAPIHKLFPDFYERKPKP
jgi:hypothetical protein